MEVHREPSKSSKLVIVLLYPIVPDMGLDGLVGVVQIGTTNLVDATVLAFNLDEVVKFPAMVSTPEEVEVKVVSPEVF